MMPPMGMPGIYHRIEKNQTLWRISRIYNIDLDELVRINRISDATNIEAGQLIFIPHVQKTQTSGFKSYCDDFIWPLKGRVISAFGQNFNNMINKGLDIQASRGSDVVASRSGRVVFYSPGLEGFGKTAIIEHDEGFFTVYARNSQVMVKPGEQVRQGRVIAKVGSGGRDKNNYLHFEIRRGYNSVNPYFYLP
jgi:murein DD-endopeptidase MepM/ murein hydrolase activator NlpD